jgi:hypothetical protein
VTPCKLYTYSQYPIASTNVMAPPRPIPVACTHDLYPCTSASLNIGDLLDSLAHPDVKAAFAKGQVVYGKDTRPADGTVFQMTYENSVVVVGSPCTAAEAACVPIPEGVAALVKTLRALDVQEQKRCAGM